MDDFKELEAELNRELDNLGRVSNNGNETTYRCIQYKGYFGGYGTEYWTEKEWTEHRLYIEACKADGTYGKPYIVAMTIINNPLFDDISTGYKISDIKPESYRMTILDFNK
jgi:hypothetical protein